MIVNETVNDLELNLKVSGHLSKKSRIAIFAAAGIIFVCGIVVLLIEIFLPGSEDPDYFDSVLILVLAAAFFAIGCLMKLIMKLTLKRTMQGKISTNRFTFSDDGYEISTTVNDGTASTANGVYTGFTECREYLDLWILYINRATMFVCLKSGMKEGTAAELTTLLKSKLGSKYKILYKK